MNEAPNCPLCGKPASPWTMHICELQPKPTTLDDLRVLLEKILEKLEEKEK